MSRSVNQCNLQLHTSSKADQNTACLITVAFAISLLFILHLAEFARGSVTSITALCYEALILP